MSDINTTDEMTELTPQYEHVSLPDVMGTSYVDYAMSVITDRALPDVRDGLKPVQRRILYAMNEMKNTPDKQHRKCARIVGETMGKFHPHGDSALYGALVYMAQPFNMRNVLIDGHGNFGSMDGDQAAAMRYTEARLSKLSMELLRDMDKNTVDFIPNFDNTEQEPTVLPSRFPNLLVNGTQGIAVGMASNMPPHNLREVCNAAALVLDNEKHGKETPLEDLLKIMPGPDFPTGASILGNSWKEIYATGQGKVELEAKHHIEQDGKKSVIVFTEIPFHVNKANLVADIAKYAKEKKLDITDVRDETNREGLRLVVELKRHAMPELVLNNLLQHTQLRSTFSAHMLCLVDGQPKTLNLNDLLKYYLEHQEEVIRRRTVFDMDKAQKRRHVVQGLLIAIDAIDDVVDTIRQSSDADAAKEALMSKFSLDDIQAQTILDLRLKTLTGLEKEKLETEFEDLGKQIEQDKIILSDRKALLSLLRKEILEIGKKYGDDRKSVHQLDYNNIEMEDLIEDEECIIIRTHFGYLKRMKPNAFRVQKKGGKGSRVATVNEDYIEDMISTTAHKRIMFFTNLGRVYSLKAWQIPESTKAARGSAIPALLKLQPNEKVTGVTSQAMDGEDDGLLLITKHGIGKRISACNLPETIRANGLNIIKLDDTDEVCGTLVVNANDIIMVTTQHGYCAAYPVSLFRPMGRAAHGVKTIKLIKKDEVVSVMKKEEGGEVAVITQRGYAKRIPCDQFRIFLHRNAMGTRCIQKNTMERVGLIVKAFLVEDTTNDLILTTSSGQTIKTRIDTLPVYSRQAMGTRMINLSHDPDGVIADMAMTAHEEPAEPDEDEINESLEANDVPETSEAETPENTDETADDNVIDMPADETDADA